MSQLGLDLTEDVITKVINAQPWAIERVLIILRDKITDYLSDQRDNPHPEADQNRGSFFYSHCKSRFHGYLTKGTMASQAEPFFVVNRIHEVHGAQTFGFGR